MATPIGPRADLAARTLPAGLYRAVRHVFEQGVFESMLVGGTALAGFYAAHRRSDDIDLFCRTDDAHRVVRLAIQSLVKIGATLGGERRTAQFYSARCELDRHLFTVDAVLDTGLFEVGEAVVVEGIAVASLDTLLMTKAATLVSRCGEKDLYDLLWIFAHRPTTVPELIDLGHRVDAGVSGEAILSVLAGTTLRKEACDFGTEPGATPEAVFETVTELQSSLQRALSEHLRSRPVPPLGELVRRLRSWSDRART